jgi:hypothetical protein
MNLSGASLHSVLMISMNQIHISPCQLKPLHHKNGNTIQLSRLYQIESLSQLINYRHHDNGLEFGAQQLDICDRKKYIYLVQFSDEVEMCNVLDKESWTYKIDVIYL